MPLIGDSLPAAVVTLLVAGGLLVIVGPRAVHLADELADVTRLGEAVMGALFLGAVTSLPDIMASVAPAIGGAPELAISNGLGGITAQTAFLALADLTYRRANLEHAAVSVPNMIQATVIVALLGLVLLASVGPAVEVWAIHPVTPVLVGVYLYGLRLAAEATEDPQWKPELSAETVRDEPDPESGRDSTLISLWLRFGAFAILLAATGWAVGHAGITIADQSGLSQTAVGALITGVASSVSEFVVAVSAIRQGALTLAVGNVIGGNTFDTLIVGVADVAYRDGSIYQQVTDQHVLVIALAIVLTVTLLMGLLRRQRHGVANIGFESAAVLVLYAGGALLLLR